MVSVPAKAAESLCKIRLPGPTGRLLKSEKGGEQLPSGDDVTRGTILLLKHQPGSPAFT